MRRQFWRQLAQRRLQPTLPPASQRALGNVRPHECSGPPRPFVGQLLLHWQPLWSPSAPKADGDEGPTKDKKTRKRRKKPKQTEDMDKLGVTKVAALVGTVVGDLTEFGVTSGTMAVELAPEEVPPALQITSSSLPPATATSRTPCGQCPCGWVC